MRSTFLGFEIARSGMQASQNGLDVTGQNISNANTEGYTRQQVDQSAARYDSITYRLAQFTSKTVGQGVNVDGISQIRDQFLDRLYRETKSEDSTINTTLSALLNVNNVLDETNTDGLDVMLQDMYNELQTLTSHTGEVDFSGIVRSSAQKVTQTLNQYAKQLNDISAQEKYSLGVVVSKVNTTLQKIQDLNISIANQKLQGNNINELLDTRNNYLDQLSDMMNISVTDRPDGTVSIMSGTTSMLDAATNTVTKLAVANNADGTVSIQNAANSANVSIAEGSIKGYMQIINGKGAYAGAGDDTFKGIPYYMQSLNDFASKFSGTFNGLNTAADGTLKPLFATMNGSATITAANITLSQAWLNDANYITPSTKTPAGSGDNDNIYRMLAALDNKQTISSSFTGTFNQFANSLMNDIFVDAGYYKDIASSSSIKLNSVMDSRESVSGVSINDEAANMMKYQKAFEASSRIMTVLDEALDIIINKMGVVGR